MLGKPRTFISILCIVLTSSSLTYAQREVGIPFKKKAAVLLEFAAPYETMRVSFKERKLSTNIYTEVRLSDDVALKTRKGKPADPASFLPGMEVLLDGKKLRSGFTFSAVRLQTKLNNWRVKLSGIYEKFEDPVATIDGRRVVLARGATIKGTGPWKKKRFKSFDYMQLGSFVEIEGSRDATGLIQARKVKTWPNLLTDADKATMLAISSGLQIPEKLSGGQMTVGGVNFQLTRNLDLQAFVTEVGYSLIPKWTEDLAEDDPTKVDYRFYVINDPSFNASAFPDGTVIVHTGLLQTVANEAQLAAVLAHEIAHVTHEHGRQRLQDQKKFKKVKTGGGFFKDAFEIVTGKTVNTGNINAGGLNIPIDLVAKLGAGALSNAYSRKRESQADRVGLFYMVEAGYDPREAATLWTLLAERTKNPEAGLLGKVKQKFASIYASHPEAVKRARNINIEIAANYSAMDMSQLTTGTDSYQDIHDQKEPQLSNGGNNPLAASNVQDFSVNGTQNSSKATSKDLSVNGAQNSPKATVKNLSVDNIQFSDPDTSIGFIRAKLDGKTWEVTTVFFNFFNVYDQDNVVIRGVKDESFMVGYNLNLKISVFTFQIVAQSGSVGPGDFTLQGLLSAGMQRHPVTGILSNKYEGASGVYNSTSKNVYAFDPGRITLSRISKTRVTGSFAGVMSDTAGNLIKVTEGRFDITNKYLQ